MPGSTPCSRWPYPVLMCDFGLRPLPHLINHFISFLSILYHYVYTLFWIALITRVAVRTKPFSPMGRRFVFEEIWLSFQFWKNGWKYVFVSQDIFDVQIKFPSKIRHWNVITEFFIFSQLRVVTLHYCWTKDEATAIKTMVNSICSEKFKFCCILEKH